jgi:hypothetical protein
MSARSSSVAFLWRCGLQDLVPGTANGAVIGVAGDAP